MFLPRPVGDWTGLPRKPRGRPTPRSRTAVHYGDVGSSTTDGVLGSRPVQRTVIKTGGRESRVDQVEKRCTRPIPGGRVVVVRPAARAGERAITAVVVPKPVDDREAERSPRCGSASTRLQGCPRRVIVNRRAAATSTARSRRTYVRGERHEGTLRRSMMSAKALERRRTRRSRWGEGY